MIVKNEAPVISRCLDSVRPLISHWVIVDTGSTDGTQDVIREQLKDIPGTLHERPWQNFAFNRTEALQLARFHGDYALIMDADDILEIPADYTLPHLTADGYELAISDEGLLYGRILLASSRVAWFYRGVLHEFLVCLQPHSLAVLPSLRVRRYHDSARRRDPETFARDARLLEKALETEDDPYMVLRYTFYLAQSYRDYGQWEKALKNYEARAAMGGWQEEVYVSLLYAGFLKEILGRPDDEVIATFEAATAVVPARAEAAYAASRYCRQRNLHDRGYDIAKASLGKPIPEGATFRQPMVYETGLLDEFAIHAYWTGHYGEALDACLKLLESGKLNGTETPRILANARHALEQLNAAASKAEAGAAGRWDFASHVALDPERPARAHDAPHPRVLVAILAREWEPALALHLQCIEALDYPKSSIVLYIRTDSSGDAIEQTLREWIARAGAQYAAIDLDIDRGPVDAARDCHAMGFKAQGRIRNASLQKAVEHGCRFHLVSEPDNFMRRSTLAELVALNLPIVAPLLRSAEPKNPFSNYHAEIDANGYYKECDAYYQILNRRVKGVIEVPVVNGTYLVRADVIGQLTYVDPTDRHSYVVFSDSARRARIPQYFDNRQIYGYIATGDDAASRADAAQAARRLMAGDGTGAA